MEKFKKFFGKFNAKKFSAIAVAMSVMAVPMMALAEDTGTGANVSASVTSAMQTIVSDTITSITAIAPIAITVFSCMFVWSYGKKFFKKITG